MAAVKGEGKVLWSDLPEFTEGLIALTGDEEGPLAKAWGRGNRKAVEDSAKRLVEYFGKDNVCVEVQRRHQRGPVRGIHRQCPRWHAPAGG